MFWVGLGYFEAVGFQKRNLAHYMYGDALVGFGMVLGILARSDDTSSRSLAFRPLHHG